MPNKAKDTRRIKQLESALVCIIRECTSHNDVDVMNKRIQSIEDIACKALGPK